ncbi:MAG: hypothetical protein ABEJ82_07580 [Haloplanus sp.]
MESKRHIVGALVALLLLSTVPAAVSAVGITEAHKVVVGHPELHASAPNNEFTAGTESTLDLYMLNDGVITKTGPAAYESRVKTARSTRLDISADGTPLTVHTAQYPIGSVPDGRSGPYPVRITVPEGTKPGTYYLTVHATYKFTSSVLYDPAEPRYHNREEETTFEVPVVVNSRAEFAVVGSRTNASVNERGTFDLTIRNTGSEVARHAVVRVTSPTDTVTFGARGRTASSAVATWEPNETKTFTYDVAVGETSAAHDYSVPVNVTFDDANGITRHAKRQVATLHPRSEQTFGIEGVQSSLRIGRSDGELVGTVVNHGPKTVHDVSVVVQSNYSYLSFDQQSYALSDLDPGESASFRFSGGTVSDEANASAIPVDLAVRYDNGRDDQYTSSTHQVNAEVGPHRNLFSVEAVNSIPAGTRGDTPKDSDWSTLRFRVTNRGEQTLYDVRPNLVFDSQYFERPVESNYRTGVITKLEPGESKTVTYAVSASSTAGGTTYPLDVRVDYERANGVRRETAPYTVPVDIDSTSSIPLLPVGGGAVLLAGLLIGGVIWWRRSPDDEAE